MEVTDNQIIRIRGSHKNQTTQGFICTKVSRFAQRVYSKERLLYPMKRVREKGSGEFKRISWQEAAETIWDTFKRIKEEWSVGAQQIQNNYIVIFKLHFTRIQQWEPIPFGQLFFYHWLFHPLYGAHLQDNSGFRRCRRF
ncbi:MAG: molybdopterin-dependent oxidoreductase [bacterium]